MLNTKLQRFALRAVVLVFGSVILAMILLSTWLAAPASRAADFQYAAPSSSSSTGYAGPGGWAFMPFSSAILTRYVGPGGAVTIPTRLDGHRITSIANMAFDGCSNLTSVTIPNGVTNIGDWAFAGCTSLASVELPNSVTRLGRFAFGFCTSLTSVIIPNSVTNLEELAFSGCSGLASLTISATSIGKAAFTRCSSLTNLIISNGSPPSGLTRSSTVPT